MFENLVNDNAFSNLFVSFTPTKQELPIMDDKEQIDSSNLFDPYSDANLQIPSTGTSFAPTKGNYASMLDKLGIQQSTSEASTSEYTTPTTPGKVSKSTTDFFEEVEPMIRRSVDKHSSELGIQDQNQKELAIKCIAAQMALETGRGTSSLWKNYNNPGGLTYTTTASKYGGRKGNKQPDGNSNYIYFNNRADAVEMMVDGFYNKMGRYKGILAQSKSISDFVTRIKKAGYFGGNLNDYIRNCESFAKQYDSWKRS